MYGSYRDVLKRSDRFTPEGRPVWPLGIHGPAQAMSARQGQDAQRLAAKPASAVTQSCAHTIAETAK